MPNFLKSLYRYFHYRFRMKTHIITTGLKPGEYHDYDTKILAGVFESVTEFVNIEGPKICWDADPGHKSAWQVFSQTAEWWTRVKEENEDPGDYLFDNRGESMCYLIGVVDHLDYLWL